MSVTFESYERRIDQIKPVMEKYGIKDFDNKNHSSNYILVLGEGKRYAIDNYIFDPIFVAFLLIRENIIRQSKIYEEKNGYNYYENQTCPFNSFILCTRTGCLCAGY